MSSTALGSLVRACVATALALGFAFGAVSPIHAAPSSAPGGLSSSGTTIPTLTWDRMPGATEYQVQGSETESFSSLSFEAVTSNAVYVPTRSLKSGQLYWRVRANDGQGWGPYSAPAAFIVTLVAPPTNLTVSGGQATSPPVKPPVVRWNPVQGAVSYTLQVDDEGDEVGGTTYDTIRGTSFVVPRPQAMGDYFVRVRANFDFGLQTQFTAWVKYDVDRLPDVTAAACASGLVCAPSLAEGIRPSVSVRDVVMDWDPVPGASKYEIWVAKDISFNTTIDGPREVIGTRYSPVATYDNAPYFWKVRAINAAGEKMPWPTVPNQFQRRWNMQPTLLYPPNDIASPVADDLYFQWTPVKHASSYRLDVGSDANFTPGSYNTCYTAQTTYTPGHGHSGSVDLCQPSQGSVVYWRVKPLDRPTGTEGIFSDTDPGQPDNQAGRFVYDSGFVTLLSPSSGAVLDNNVNLPTFRWSPQVDAHQYEVEIRNASNNVVASVTTSALSWTPYDKLDPAQGPFRWTVVAVDGDGKRSPKLSQGRQFSLASAAPGGTPLAPLPGSYEPVGFRMPSLTWNGMTGAAYYRLHVAEAGYQFPQNATDVLGRNLAYPSVTDPSRFFVKPGTYTWWVSAFDAQGGFLGGGTTATFTITRPGAVAGQRLALDGMALDANQACSAALVNAGAFCDGVPSTPVLDWGSTPGAGGYLVYLAWDGDVSNRVLEPYAGTINSRWTPTRDILNALKDNESQESYYWFIRPCMSLNPITNCGPDPANQANSATHAFRKVSPTVRQLAPAADSVERGSEVTFVWEDYRDTNAQVFFAGGQQASHQSAKSYRIQVSQSSTITDANALQDVTVVDQATFTSFSRTYPEGDLWWRVQAIDDNDNRLAWSETRKFVKSTPTTNLDPTTAITNERSLDASAFPSFGSHQPAGSTTFAWNAYDFDGTWRLEVYKNNDTTAAEGSLVLRRDVYQAAFSADEPIPASSEAYRWRVRRVDVNGNVAAWSDWGSFFVDPATPVLDSPVDGGVQPPNGLFFQWQPLAGARNYRVSLLSSGGDELQTETTSATAWAVPRSVPTGSYRWQVRALDLSGRVIGTSQRAVVVDAQLLASAPPTIQAPTGTGVGATLTSTAPAWTQSDVATTYQWMRDGGNIFQATQSTYTLTLDDFGKDVSLKVTGRRPSYADGTSVSNVIRVTAGGALQATSQPQILGTPAPGNMLTVENPSWSQPFATVTYQWLRTGAPIPRATNGSYSLTPEDAGKEVSVVIFAKRTGFADGSVTAPSVAVAKLTSTTQSTLSATRIKRGRTLKVGVTVTVPGVATPTGTVKIQDGVKTLKSFTMDPFRKGVMTVKLSTKKLKVGRHKIKLVYMGNSSTNSSKAKVIRLVVFR